jgi:hypothetical protein
MYLCQCGEVIRELELLQDDSPHVDAKDNSKPCQTQESTNSAYDGPTFSIHIVEASEKWYEGRE